MKWRRPLLGMAAVAVTAGICLMGASAAYGGWDLGRFWAGDGLAGGQSDGRDDGRNDGQSDGEIDGQRLAGEKRHWNLGDVVERELDGKVYRFQCIDQNYSDRMEYHKPAALFLCTTVIPADAGSEYRYEELADGRFDYVFYPGPVVNFGEGNDYKYSAVRRWLEKCESGVPGAVDINTGVDLAYEGRTEEGLYGQLNAEGVRGSYIGSQKLTERLFCLSVDEAIKYREYLWRFEEGREENPESQYGPYSKGYWLRNPVGDGTHYEDTGMVYIVDLVNGNIRPQAVKPEGKSGTGELDVTGTTGLRPAFAMPQDS